jgi:hypothetical protein
MTETPPETHGATDTALEVPSATALVRAAKAGLAGNQALNHELEGRVAELEAAWGGPAALSPQQRGRIRDICMAEFLQGCLEGWMAGRDYLISGKEGHQQASMVIGEWQAWKARGGHGHRRGPRPGDRSRVRVHRSVLRPRADARGARGESRQGQHHAEQRDHDQGTDGEFPTHPGPARGGRRLRRDCLLVQRGRVAQPGQRDSQSVAAVNGERPERPSHDHFEPLRDATSRGFSPWSRSSVRCRGHSRATGQ